MKKVITYGTFDLFHQGHINLLKRAKELGDYLIVGITTEHFDEERGKINVVNSIMERIENVRKSGFADEIIIEDHDGQKIGDIQKYGVDIFTVGSDWIGTFDYLNTYCDVVYLERTPDVSSTILRANDFRIIRLGIVGTGRITPRFLSEVKFVSGVFIKGVYNPHRDSAVVFEKNYEVEAFYGEFEEFLNEVDAIYIATPNETHYDYCKCALQNGKHVLCEKPMVFKKSEAIELFELADENELILMEGIKTAYCPGFSQMMNIVKSGKIGAVRDVEACFTRLADYNTREVVDSRYGGAFLEYGSYTLLPILKLLGVKYDDIQIESILADNGVDAYTKIHITYDNGLALSKTGVSVKSEGQLIIAGTNGYILAESPWWLTRKFEVRYEDPNHKEQFTPRFLGDGLRYEISEFVSKINGRGGNISKLSREESIAMADIVERFMEKREQQHEKMLNSNKNSKVRIWAHRGGSNLYPENTLQAFIIAAKIEGIAGVELDVQLSKDGKIVVFHDETLNRLMDKTGYVQDYTFDELQQARFKAWDYCGENCGVINYEMKIPTLEEVLAELKTYCLDKNLKINIELKNSVIHYPNMEEKVIDLVNKFELEQSVVYSSFSNESVKKLKRLKADANVAILGTSLKECQLFYAEQKVDGLHPCITSVISEFENKEKLPIRVWNSVEPFYGQDGKKTIYDLCRLERRGVTDFITNYPEKYLVK